MVVDRLSKQRHFVPCKDSITAEGLAQLFLDHVFGLHGLPTAVVSGCEPRFASHFWSHLYHCLGIDPRLSKAFHPQTDGQTERINAAMGEYLRAYVNHQQDDWIPLLAVAEFVGYNQVSASTGVSPFYATASRHPRVDFELDIRVDSPEEAQAQWAAARLADIHDFLRARLLFSQAKQADGADARRLPAPLFHPGDYVFLDTQNMRTVRPCRILDDKNAGPFRVLRPVSPRAYELELPATMELRTRVFHSFLLKLAWTNHLPCQRNVPPPPVIVRDHEEWLVDSVVDSRWHYGTLQY